MSSLLTRIHSRLPYSQLNDVRRVLCYLEWWISRVRIRLIIILLTLWSEIFSSFDSSLGLKCVFFCQSGPFPWKWLLLGPTLLIFGFHWVFPRVASLAPSPSYISLLFSKFFSLFALFLPSLPFSFSLFFQTPSCFPVMAIPRTPDLPI